MLWNIASFFCPTEGEGGSRGLGFNILIFKNCQKTRFANIVVSHCDKDNLSLSEKSAGDGRPRKSVQHIFLFLRDAIYYSKGPFGIALQPYAGKVLCRGAKDTS